MGCGQSEEADREVGQDVDGVGNDKHDGVLFHAGGFNAVKDLGKEADVTVDEIQTAFIGLAAQAGGDDKDVRVSSAVVITCIDALIVQAGSTVQEVEGLAVGKVLVGIKNLDF